MNIVFFLIIKIKNCWIHVIRTTTLHTHIHTNIHIHTHKYTHTYTQIYTYMNILLSLSGILANKIMLKEHDHWNIFTVAVLQLKNSLFRILSLEELNIILLGWVGGFWQEFLTPQKMEVPRMFRSKQMLTIVAWRGKCLI